MRYLVAAFALGMLLMALITPRQFSPRVFSPDVIASDNGVAINGDGNQVAYNPPEPPPARTAHNPALLAVVLIGFVASSSVLAGTLLYIWHGAQMEMGHVPEQECVQPGMEA